MQLSNITMAFLVDRSDWRVITEQLKQCQDSTFEDIGLEAFARVLEDAQLPILQNSATWHVAHLGNLQLGDAFPDPMQGLRTHWVARFWYPFAFEIVITLPSDQLDRLGAGETELLKKAFVPWLRTWIAESGLQAMSFLSACQGFVDPTLSEVSEDEGARSYLAEHSLPGVVLDVYWSAASPRGLYCSTPGALAEPYDILIAPTGEELKAISHAWLAAAHYRAAREIHESLVNHATASAAKDMETTRQAQQRLIGRADLLSLVASFYPSQRKRIESLDESIVEVTNTLWEIAESRTHLRYLRLLAEHSPGYLRTSMILLRKGVARGWLIDMQPNDVGTLELSAYLKRCETLVLDNSDQELLVLSDRLGVALDSLRTLAAARSGRETGVLNRLVFVLTTLAVPLALMQVLTATTIWKGAAPVVIIGIFVLLAIISVFTAHHLVKSKEKHKEPSARIRKFPEH